MRSAAPQLSGIRASCLHVACIPCVQSSRGGLPPRDELPVRRRQRGPLLCGQRRLERRRDEPLQLAVQLREGRLDRRRRHAAHCGDLAELAHRDAGQQCARAEVRREVERDRGERDWLLAVPRAVLQLLVEVVREDEARDLLRDLQARLPRLERGCKYCQGLDSNVEIGAMWRRGEGCRCVPMGQRGGLASAGQR